MKRLVLLACLPLMLSLLGCPPVPDVECLWQLPGTDTDRLASTDGVTLRISVAGSYTAEDLPAVHFFSDVESKLLESGILVADSGCADGCPAGDRFEGILTPGTHVLSAQALTPQAAVACEASKSLTVNSPPSVTSVTFTPETPLTGDDITYVATTSDPEDDAVTVSGSWVGPDGQELVGESLNNLNTAAGETWTLSVAPRDGMDLGQVFSADVTIANTPPTEPTVVIDPSPGRVDAQLRCAVTDLDDLDPDDDELTVLWSWTVDSADAGIVTDVVTPDLTLAGEEWECTAAVDDGTDTGPSSSASTTIADDITVPATVALDDEDVVTGVRGLQYVGGANKVGYPGDVDGDGLADFVLTVNDEVCDIFCDGVGHAYLFLGSSPVPGDLDDADADFIGPTGFNMLAPWAAGDLNGDDIDDLVFPHASATQATTGGGSGVYLLFSSEDGFSAFTDLDDEESGAVRIKNQDGEHLAPSPCPVGDLDGDGFADLALTSPGAENGSGRVYVVYGHPGTWLSGLEVNDLVPSFRITGAGSGQVMGHACAGRTDVDGNGHPDLVVSAIGAAAQGQGRVMVYYMDGERLSGEFTSASADVIIDGNPSSPGGFGGSLTALGDHDGDGLDDFAIFEWGPEVTNPNPPPNDAQAGTVWIASPGHPDFGPAMTYDMLPYSIDGAGNLGFCGHPGAADVDGDGLGDLICGDTRPQEADDIGELASVRVFLGSWDGIDASRDRDDADVVLTSPVHDHLAGLSVVGLPDRDGDLYDEVLVGATGRDGPNTDSGGVYIVNLAN